MRRVEVGAVRRDLLFVLKSREEKQISVAHSTYEPFYTKMIRRNDLFYEADINCERVFCLCTCTGAKGIILMLHCSLSKSVHHWRLKFRFNFSKLVPIPLIWHQRVFIKLHDHLHFDFRAISGIFYALMGSRDNYFRVNYRITFLSQMKSCYSKLTSKIINAVNIFGKAKDSCCE